jgi:hypothetical protein
MLFEGNVWTSGHEKSGRATAEEGRAGQDINLVVPAFIWILTNVGGTLFFAATTAPAAMHFATTAPTGTVLVKDINPGTSNYIILEP